MTRRRRNPDRYRKRRRLRYAPRRLKLPPPFQVNDTLRSIGLGLTIGEGSAKCEDRSPVIAVKMCDEKAVQMLGKSWGTAVFRGMPLGCLPTPENPEGKQYVITAKGTRANIIMKNYEPEIIGTQIHKKWLAKKEECLKKTPKERRKKLTL